MSILCRVSLTSALILAGWLLVGPVGEAMEPAAPPQEAGATAQPEMTTLKSTFIPGDKTLFFDDFTDMTADDAPPHFKVRGSAPALRAAGNIRQLTITQRGSIFPNLTTLPKNFTYEAEIKADATGRAITTLMLVSKTSRSFTWVRRPRRNRWIWWPR